MLILLDCRPLQDAGSGSERARFILSCAAGLTAREGVEWLFLVDKGLGDLLLPAGKKVLARKAFPGRAGQTLWYDWLIPRTARRYKADLIMTTDGRIPASIKIPQCCWMPCRPKPDKTLEGAMAIFCFTEKERDLLQARYGTGVLVHPAADEQVTPLSPEEREKVKGEMADGKEYFLTDITGAAPSEVVNLLKAFSLFKKRQLSNMKLVLAGKGDPTLAGKLGSYKYRQDVCRHPGPPADHWQRLAGAAYAIICLFRKDDLGIALLNSWKAGVPVIASSTGCIHEPGEAVLLVPEGDPAPLA